MPTANQINPPTALLTIDMQQGIARVSAPRNNPGAEQKIAALHQHWRAMGWPLVHIRHISRQAESVFAPGQSGALFQPAFEPQAGEYVLEKNVTDAFCHSALERWLHVRGIEQLVIVGVASENSVEATARSASNLGFKTLVIHDACYTFDKTDFAGQSRRADDVHNMAMANLRDEYAEVIGCSELVKRFAAQP
ncbi:cysteine hydrolase family protein [Pseudomonas sp. EL_65y_Pfl2_R95]|uniref:cysteine hydrolase family protein n=1 Tax=Pseudomonas sp. EL_65y_Pfl2_R95 TaxID=3088698 RepID=UPI0030DA9046